MPADHRSAEGAHPYRPVNLGLFEHSFEDRPDGATIVRCLEPLGPYPDRLTDWLVHFAHTAPDRTFVAKRGPDGAWQRLTYAQALVRAEALGGALLARGLGPERPLAILSGNDLDHAALALAALHVGIPYAPVSPAYSTIAAGDFARLKDVLGLVRPALVFAADGDTYGRAIRTVLGDDVEVVTSGGGFAGRQAAALAALEEEGRAHLEIARAAHERVGPDSVAKILFTSGSTGLPKGVLTTHKMLCANQAQINTVLRFLQDEPPVLVDWLPWHHVFGGSHNFGIALFNGGSLYVDDGRPTSALIGETIRNLREIAPSAYFTVPKGYEVLIPALETDGALRDSFFSRLQVAFFAAAGLPQPVWDAFDAVAMRHCGERIVMLTGLGATESAPFALSCRPDQSRSGHVGLPVPGLTLKLAPVADKHEARIQGPNVAPGYWRNDSMTAAAFDADGFYKLGDALTWVDPDQGLFFDGRLNEDFKLTSGVWVSVGPLRAKFLDRAAPYARDVAIAGENRDEIAALIVPDVEACRALCPDIAAGGSILRDRRVAACFTDILRAAARDATGSSHRIARAIILEEPPSIDLNEVTDKGSINQRTTLRNRSALVDELYRRPLGPRVIAL